LRATDSRTIRRETGRREIGPKPFSSSAGSETNRPVVPGPDWNEEWMPGRSITVRAMEA
jgi:hypothetical protein